MSRIIAYCQLGGHGERLHPLTRQANSFTLNTKRNLMPHNHNSYYARSKHVMDYFGIALSEPLLRGAVLAGVKDLRATLSTMPETISRYYLNRDLGSGVTINMYLTEHIPLDTAGGIVRDVMASIKTGTIKKHDTILVLPGDTRTDINFEEFLEEHNANPHADITIAMTRIKREEMYRFGSIVRESDNIENLGKILLIPSVSNAELEHNVYGNAVLNDAKTARIIGFIEKAPRLYSYLVEDPRGLNIREVLEKYGTGALSPTTQASGAIYAIRAELIEYLAPLVFNMPREASAYDWANASTLNNARGSKFTDFGGDLFMAMTGDKQIKADMHSPTFEAQQKIIDELKKHPPQIFGYKIDGKWRDDGTLPALLSGQFEILEELVRRGKNASWPIDWGSTYNQFGSGIISMTMLDRSLLATSIIPPVFIGKNVIINPMSRVGPFAIVGNGWEVFGSVDHSVLFPKTNIDNMVENKMGAQNRFRVKGGMNISGSIIGSGFESFAVDHNGELASLENINNSVVVSNGMVNVISPLDI